MNSFECVMSLQLGHRQVKLTLDDSNSFNAELDLDSGWMWLPGQPKHPSCRRGLVGGSRGLQSTTSTRFYCARAYYNVWNVLLSSATSPMSSLTMTTSTLLGGLHVVPTYVYKALLRSTILQGQSTLWCLHSLDFNTTMRTSCRVSSRRSNNWYFVSGSMRPWST